MYLKGDWLWTASASFILLWIAWQDYRTRKISNRLLLVMLLLGLASTASSDIPIQSRIAGAFLTGAPLLLAAWIRPGALGGGDIKLFAAAGAIIGARWSLHLFCLSFELAGAVSVWLLLTGRKKRDGCMALGPFLCISLIFFILLIKCS